MSFDAFLFEKCQFISKIFFLRIFVPFSAYINIFVYWNYRQIRVTRLSYCCALNFSRQTNWAIYLDYQKMMYSLSNSFCKKNAYNNTLEKA